LVCAAGAHRALPGLRELCKCCARVLYRTVPHRADRKDCVQGLNECMANSFQVSGAPMPNEGSKVLVLYPFLSPAPVLVFKVGLFHGGVSRLISICRCVWS